jgi:DNA-binding transcriptional LysR family regulator
LKLGEPTLDQLRIFLAVVEQGSFGGAARQMGRAISAISYGIAQMEALLDVTLFAREGSRKPVLTDAGKGVLAEAQAIVDASDALRAKTQSLHAGLESDIALVLDVMFPGDATAQVLRQFREMFPTVALRLNIEALGAVTACLMDNEAQLAVTGPIVTDHPSLERQLIGEVDLIPVAAPDHPLSTGEIAPGETRKHLQLVLSDRSNLTEGREFSVLSPLTWRLADLGAKHALLKEGIGWGNMPVHMVRGDIERGRLVKLNLPEEPGARYGLNATWRRDARPGPATSWLIDAIREELGNCTKIHI